MEFYGIIILLSIYVTWTRLAQFSNSFYMQFNIYIYIYIYIYIFSLTYRNVEPKKNNIRKARKTRKTRNFKRIKRIAREKIETERIEILK